MSVEPAGVRQDPETCCTDSGLLWADRDIPLVERGAVGAHAENREIARSEGLKLPDETPGTATKLAGGQLSGLGCRARNEVRYADAQSR